MTQKTPLSKQMELAALMVDMVIDGKSKALFLYGSPGIGKSSEVFSRFDQKQKVMGRDYVVVKGITRPMGLYMVLYDNRDGTIVFDDCDTAWGDNESANILKAALELGDKRIVSFHSKAVKDAGIPTSFEFTGGVIFVSNIGEDAVDTAIRSRSYSYGVFATHDEMVALMHDKILLIEPSVRPSEKREVLDYIVSVSDKLRTFDLRTLVKAIKLRQYSSDQWKELVPMFV